MSESTGGVRRAEPGELCTCGRQAVDVYEGGRYGATGHCGLADGGAPVDGVCVFCGDTIDHTHYARAEHAAGRPAAHAGDGPQGGRCPLYRLRLADPLPSVHAESVRRFDPAADRVARARHRLTDELHALLVAAGRDQDEADISANATADYVTEVAAKAGDQDPHGLLAVTAMLAYLVEDFAEIGTTPNPAEVSPAALAVTLEPEWSQTPALERPHLAARRLAADLTA